MILVMERGDATLRTIDRLVGIPLTWLLSLGKWRRRQLPAHPARIGILASAAIGDTIILSACLADLHAAFPDTELLIFAGPSNLPMARMTCPWAGIVPISVGNPLKDARTIRAQGRFDLWIDTGQWPRINSLLSWSAKSGCTLGFRTPGQGRHFLFDQTVNHRNDIHELENYRALIGRTGAAMTSTPRLEPQHNGTAVVKRVVLHMFPGGFKSGYKEWAQANWLWLANELLKMGFSVGVTGAGADTERAVAFAEALGNPQGLELVAGRLKLGELPAYLSASAAVVSVNTGVMHVAAALGCPLVALHGPTSPLRWGPLCERSVNLCASTQSAGCLNLGFEYDDNDQHSLDTIAREDVLAAVKKVMVS
jgi:heptosyltransferase I